MLFNLLALSSFATAVAATLNPIVVKGNAFYDSVTNKRFYIKGVDYLPGGASNFVDPLMNESACSRDIKYFKELGLNAIRVYSVDNSVNHDKCMQLLDEAGIYLILDVNTPQNSINRASPANSYNTAYLQHVFATVDAFKNYTNVLGFFAANEVINDEATTQAAPYVKAVIRDMKAYIKNQAPRQIPVGYSAADIASNRLQQADYFNCGKDEERLDMFGMNDYSWCGRSSFTLSGYNNKVDLYSGYTKPIFLSEFGCNAIRPRPFTEVEYIYSEHMSDVFSGGLVYEYTEEANRYGLVEFDAKGDVMTNADFDNLKAELAKISVPQGNGGASSSNKSSDCPPMQQGVWDVDSKIPLPAMPVRASAFLTLGAGKPLGTNGPSTAYGDLGDIPGNLEVIESSSSESEKPKTTSSSTSSSVSSSTPSSSLVLAAAIEVDEESEKSSDALSVIQGDRSTLLFPMVALVVSALIGSMMIL